MKYPACPFVNPQTKILLYAGPETHSLKNRIDFIIVNLKSRFSICVYELLELIHPIFFYIFKYLRSFVLFYVIFTASLWTLARLSNQELLPSFSGLSQALRRALPLQLLSDKDG